MSPSKPIRPPRPLEPMKRTLLIVLVTLVASGCSRPGDRALSALERGLDTLTALVERRDRGELDEAAFGAALLAWEREGRTIERLGVEAARSAGPEERSRLERRWRELSTRLGARLSAISEPRPALGE